MLLERDCKCLPFLILDCDKSLIKRLLMFANIHSDVPIGLCAIGTHDAGMQVALRFFSVCPEVVKSPHTVDEYSTLIRKLIFNRRMADYKLSFRLRKIRCKVYK